MNERNRLNGVVMRKAGPAVILLMFVACATSAPDRAAKAASSLDVMQQNSARARTQIDAVVSSLDTLLDAPADRLRESYDRYARNVKQMNQYADAIRENETDLRNNGNDYLREWQRDAANISDPELRKIAEERRAQIGQSSQSTRATLTSAVGTFETFLRDINDLQKALGNDLTPTGQENVRQTAIVQRIRSEGDRVKAAVRDAEESIERLRSQITPTS
jgi:uncharacterized protein YukE